jgi:DNA-binding NtrC family response regulator
MRKFMAEERARQREFHRQMRLPSAIEYVLMVTSRMSQPESNGVVGSQPTIFVVDDEQMLLDLAEMILEPAGFQVCLFIDPQKALAEYVAAQSPPDILVTDYAMAGMNGMDLIRECKRVNPRQKTILLSGTVDEGIYNQSAVKPDHFLAKPYQINKLVEVIHSLIAQ